MWGPLLGYCVCRQEVLLWPKCWQQQEMINLVMWWLVWVITKKHKSQGPFGILRCCFCSQSSQLTPPSPVQGQKQWSTSVGSIQTDLKGCDTAGGSLWTHSCAGCAPGRRRIMQEEDNPAGLQGTVLVLATRSFLSQQMRNVPPPSIPTRSPTWRLLRQKRIPSTGPVTPSSRD